MSPQSVDGSGGMVTGEIPARPNRGSESLLDPSAVLQEARANLAFLSRFTTELSGCHEGQMYLALISEMSEKALLFALSHFGRSTAGPPAEDATVLAASFGTGRDAEHWEGIF